MWGLDLPGLAKYAKVALTEFPAGWALSTFSGTFGDSRPAVEAIIKSGRCPRIEIKLLWKDLHNFSRADFPTIKKEALKWLPMVKKYPAIEWCFCGATEHNLNNRDAVALANLVLNTLPGVTCVNNAMKQGNDITMMGVVNERHGADVVPKPQGYVFSFDGSNCVDCDVTTIKTRLADAETFFYWCCRFNGKWNMADTTPRPQRKGWPDAKMIRSIIALAEDEGKTNLPKGWLWKSHSENKGTGDPRAEKPVMIAPIRTSAIALKSDGKLIAKLPLYGTYAGGGFRYYAQKWGYEVAKIPLEVWAGGKKYGTVNPIFRCGTFR